MGETDRMEGPNLPIRPSGASRLVRSSGESTKTVKSVDTMLKNAKKIWWMSEALLQLLSSASSRFHESGSSTSSLKKVLEELLQSPELSSYKNPLQFTKMCRNMYLQFLVAELLGCNSLVEPDPQINIEIPQELRQVANAYFQSQRQDKQSL